jgi:hypothetical protein
VSSQATKDEKPMDRLTRLCDAMTVAMEAHPEYREGDKCQIFIQDGEKGGIVLSGYEDATDAMAELFFHMKAVFEANGQTLQIHALGEG